MSGFTRASLTELIIFHFPIGHFGYMPSSGLAQPTGLGHCSLASFGRLQRAAFGAFAALPDLSLRQRFVF